MIPLKELEKTTGFVPGAIHRVGVRQKHSYPIFIDQVALEREAIIVSAGEVGRSVLIKAQDLADFVKAEFADIKED